MTTFTTRSAWLLRAHSLPRRSIRAPTPTRSLAGGKWWPAWNHSCSMKCLSGQCGQGAKRPWATTPIRRPRKPAPIAVIRRHRLLAQSSRQGPVGESEFTAFPRPGLLTGRRRAGVNPLTISALPNPAGYPNWTGDGERGAGQEGTSASWLETGRGSKESTEWKGRTENRSRSERYCTLRWALPISGIMGNEPVLTPRDS